jgi:hypothetical protein
MASRKRMFWSISLIALFLALACSPCGALPALLRRSTPTPTARPADDDPVARTLGHSTHFGPVQVYAPPQAGQVVPEIAIQRVRHRLPPSPDGSTVVGEAYDIEPAAETRSPVLLTLSYDPDQLPRHAIPSGCMSPIKSTTSGRWCPVALSTR